MPVFLKKRIPELTEEMDQPDCDLHMLHNTYRQFKRMNPLLSRWQSIYKHFLLPGFRTGDVNTLLDIGFGGGDIPVQLSKWAERDGFRLHITGIETDKRALHYVQNLSSSSRIDFRSSSLDSIRNETFDFIISNHLLHHISPGMLSDMLETTASMASKRVIFNDIERSDLAYLGFYLFTGPFLRNSFARSDGLRSIRRSYTLDELKNTVPMDWEIIRLRPYRLLLTYNNPEAG